MSLYKKDLQDFIYEFKNGLLTDENEIKFMNNFYYKLPLFLGDIGERKCGIFMGLNVL